MFFTNGISGLIIGNNITTCRQDRSMLESKPSGCAGRNTDSVKDRRPHFVWYSCNAFYISLGAVFSLSPFWYIGLRINAINSGDCSRRTLRLPFFTDVRSFSYAFWTIALIGKIYINLFSLSPLTFISRFLFFCNKKSLPFYRRV